MKVLTSHLLRPLALAALLGSAAALRAQGNATLVLWHADGTQTRVELRTQPRVTFGSGTVDITSSALSESYPDTDVFKFTFEDSVTGIGATPADQTYHAAGERILFDPSVQPDQVALYNTDGVRVPLSLQQTGRGVALPLSGVPAGVYILSVNGKTSKFVKR